MGIFLKCFEELGWENDIDGSTGECGNLGTLDVVLKILMRRSIGWLAQSLMGVQECDAVKSSIIQVKFLCLMGSDLT